ncbi:Alpha/Beta hydrolase protein [Mycena rebaudengoi]|nr:Alpha/Beta hydrolase protein [Mycena rebaudengoi]
MWAPKVATVILAFSLNSALAIPSPRVVDLGYAQYQGAANASTNITTFFGIRYAAAPLADLRFRAPQPPATVTGVQQATEQPNQCWQAAPGTSSTNPLRPRAAEIISTEDCLFLNVYYPSDSVGAPPQGLPVVVFIHGGGYLGGAANMYRGTDLIAQSNRGIVVVIIQYRLGVFGFLPGVAVKKNGALNAGLLDQDFALRWVNKHISKFGGDPSKVTIWGAGSVLQHVVANNGKTSPQLFRAAISSSLFLPSQYKYSDRIPEALYSQVVSQTNCSAAADSISCLRKADVGTLQTANVNINSAAFYGTFQFVPVVDDTFITQRPQLSLAQKKVNGKALLAVTNAFEGTLFVDQSAAAPANATQYALELFPELGLTEAHTIGTLYAELGTSLSQKIAIIAESIFVCPTYLMLRAFTGRSFKSEFAIPPGMHGNDVFYYFTSIAIDFPDLAAAVGVYNNTDFQTAFSRSFASFAISLDPNIKVEPTITPSWNKWAVQNTEMLFNRTDSGLPAVKPVKTSDELLERCRFWASVGEATAQ